MASQPKRTDRSRLEVELLLHGLKGAAKAPSDAWRRDLGEVPTPSWDPAREGLEV